MQDNNLVMALLGAGVVFVLVIVVYNQWQIRKARRPEAYNPLADEAPRGEGWTDRHEPGLGGERDEIGRAEPRLEPGLAPHPHVPATGGAETEAGVIGAELTPTSEEAALEAAEADEAAEPAPGSEREVSGDRLLPAMAKLRRAGTKQIHVEGLNPAANAWETIRAGQRYLDLQVAVQLANRTGPLNALEFSEFINAIDPLSEAADGVPELPDMNETLANARELDAFAAEGDVQLGVSVISDGAPWSAAGRGSQQAVQAGLRIRLHAVAAHGRAGGGRQPASADGAILRRHPQASAGAVRQARIARHPRRFQRRGAPVQPLTEPP
jgi:hypothetical protein